MRKNIEKKQRAVEKLSQLLASSPVVGVADISYLPNKLFQRIRKELRGHATFYVSKKTVLERAVQAHPHTAPLKEHIKLQSALFLSSLEPFTLFRKLTSIRLKLAAKPGQISPQDIVVPAGETSLAPGPVLTELKNAGITAKIEKGKVVIAKDATIAKKGEPISPAAAKVLQILGIKPFEAKITVRAIQEGKITYLPDILDIDLSKFRTELISAVQNGWNLSVSITYVTPYNISLLLSKAHRDAVHVAVAGTVFEKEAMNLLIAKAQRVATALQARVS